MRNLKRALSLTLASVMLLGMMVVGSSAAGYPDVEDSHNVEAIEVLQAIGVMVGDENGNFGPDDQVNRAQMAVVMALLLDLDYNYYQGTNPFWDVPSWAEPYVAACYANGIVSGYNATTYGSGDPVTAVQAASMMMRALGYFQHQSDYADGFELSTVKQASKISLFKDINAASNTTALTRNQVAQLALNTLKTPMVEGQDNTLHITGTSGDMTMNVTGGSMNYVYVTSNDDKFNQAIDNVKASSIGNQNDGYFVELGEQLFNGDLKLEKEDEDNFGRPSNTWTYKNDKIGTYAHKSELIASYTGKVSKADIYNLLSASVRKDIEATTSTLTVWVNGDQDPSPATPGMIGTGAGIYERNNSTAIYTPVGGSTRRGTLTEVYLDKDNNVDIVIVDTFVYQATSDYSSSRDDVKMAPAGDSASTLTLKAGELTLKGEDFAITNIKTDDYLLITASNKDGAGFVVESVAVADKVEGQVTAWTAGDSVTIEGQKYSYSATAMGGNDGVKATQYTVGQPAILVMDAYGNVIAVDEAVASSSYVFVTEFGGTSALNRAAVANAYFTDGTDGEIRVDRVGDVKSASTIAGMGEVNKWYTYSVNSNGNYVLYNVPARYTPGSAVKNATVVNGYQSLIQNGKVDFLTGTVTTVSALANDKTILVLVDKDGDVMSYTGTSAIPDVKVLPANTPTVHYLMDNDGYVDYAFVNLENTGAQIVDGGEDTSFMYVLRYDGENYAANATTYYTYTTINDETGEPNVVVSFDAKIADGMMNATTKDGNHPYTLFYKPRYNSDEEISNLSTVAGAGGKYFSDTLSNDTVSYGDGSLRMGGNTYIINSSSKIYLIARGSNAFVKDSAANHEVDSVRPETLESLLRDYVVTGVAAGAFVSDSSNVVDTMYVTITSSQAYDFSDLTVLATSASAADNAGAQTTNVFRMPTTVAADFTAFTIDWDNATGDKTILSGAPTWSADDTASSSGNTIKVLSWTPVANKAGTVVVPVNVVKGGVTLTYNVAINVVAHEKSPDELKIAAAEEALGDSYTHTSAVANSGVAAAKTAIETALTAKVTGAGAAIDTTQGTSGFTWTDGTAPTDGTLTDEDGTNSTGFSVKVFITSGEETSEVDVAVTLPAVAYKNTTAGTSAARKVSEEATALAGKTGAVSSTSTTADTTWDDVKADVLAAVQAQVTDQTNTTVTEVAFKSGTFADNSGGPITITVTATIAYKESSDVSTTVTGTADLSVTITA